MEQTFESNLPIEPIIIGFFVLLVLTISISKTLRQRARIRQGQLPGARIPTIEERVLANPEWAKGEIRSAGKRLVTILWLIALAWNLPITIGFFKAAANPAVKTGPLVTLGVFALLGIGAIALAVRVTIQQMRYGYSTCSISGKAGVLGATIKGTVRTDNEVPVSGDYTVELQCLESYSVGSGKNRRTETKVHWQEKQVVPSAGKSSRSGIPFSFQLPSYPPETGYLLARGHIRWNLKIHAPVKGVDYSAMFVVPVFKVEKSEPLRSTVS